MTVQVKHGTQLGGINSPGSPVSKNVWNEAHTITGTPGKILGFDGIGNATEFDFGSYEGAFSFRSLGPVSPANGTYIGIGGNSLSFQTRISNPDPVGADTDNQRASVLIAATTSDDNNSEEQTLCILTTIETGARPAWQASTSYAVGANVINATEAYRCTKAGVSAASGGPTGRGALIFDGTVEWRWINDDVLAAKAGIYNETEVKAGAGSAWSLINNFDLRAGYDGPFAVAVETDLTNHAKDSTLGGFTAYGSWVALQGPYTSTAGLVCTTSNATNYAALWGLYLGGPKLASRAAIAIDGESAVGLAFGFSAGAAVAATFTEAAIKDASTSPKGVSLTGTYSSAGFEFTGTAPTAVNVGGANTMAAVQHLGTAPYGINLIGTYSASPIKTALLPNHADDAAAATGGLPVGAWYRTGSIVKQRVA